MFVHAGAVYRQALTPEQKKLKKKYLLEQHKKSDRIPDFEEVWKHHLTYGDLDSSIEDYAGDYTRVEADEHDVAQWMEENDIDIPEEPAYDTDEHDAWEKEYNRLVEKHEEEASQAMSEDKAREYLKHDIELAYDEAVYRIDNELDGKGCWREITLPDNIDPTEHQGLGIYWAYTEGSAEAHWGGRSGRSGGSKLVRYHARIDAENIDKRGTILANTDHSIGDDEQEVRFHYGSPIYVYDVTVYDGESKYRGRELEVLEIEDWRMT